MKEGSTQCGCAWEQMWWWVNKEWAEAETEAEQNMLIDFRWEAVGQRSTGWWWQKHSWNQWRQVVTAGKAVAATEEAVDEAAAAEAAEEAWKQQQKQQRQQAEAAEAGGNK